ncbi:hypothetical protein [Undibacterium terreum]|uniref:Uncharacterized protein n=1 Tax=Undibacterium terreum TaxID=1224302 RepID=A0A916V0F0_9BURK|nr:hypothetical protein [Undibacterium terreum]GGC97262.1 hypothetical protein GCM10011396_50970 [Undibacterium terreum]
MKNLANALLIAGILMLAAAVGWWFSFYQPIVGKLGMHLSDAGNCLYTLDGPCGLAHGAARFVGKTPYSPYLFWAAAAALLAGILLRAARAK